MNILLIIPSSPFLTDSAVFPTLGPLYLASALKEWNHHVELCDMNIGDSYRGYDPDFIGITITTAQVSGILSMLFELRRLYPNVPIIGGGPHMSACPQDGKVLGLDATCVGDGEAVMLRFIQGERGVMEGLVGVDEWPLPDRSLLKLDKYHYEIGGRSATSLMTARGCPYSCDYCSRPIGIDKVRFQNMDLVAKELSQIEELGYEAVMIYDDEVNLSSGRYQDLCLELGLRGLRWRAFMRSNLATESQVALAGVTGCWELCCGVESGSNQILQQVGKRATVEDATRLREWCAKYGVRFKAFFIIGLPGETEETVEATRQWLRDNEPDVFDICPFVPCPGSNVAKHPWRYDIIYKSDYLRHPTFYKGKEYEKGVSTSSLTAERIIELRDEIEKEFKC